MFWIVRWLGVLYVVNRLTGRGMGQCRGVDVSYFDWSKAIARYNLEKF